MNQRLLKNGENINSQNITLFCFPFAGGGASAYNSWVQKMKDTITVCPIQLPGREERIMEKPYHNMTDMLDELEETIWENIRGPYAFWGHSMGGKIAYELEKEWKKEERQPDASWYQEVVSQVFQNPIQSIIFQMTNLKRNSADLKERQRRYWKTRNFWISFCLCCELILQWMKRIMIKILSLYAVRLRRLEDGMTGKQMKQQ